jgi:hypothetical protein
MCLQSFEMTRQFTISVHTNYEIKQLEIYFLCDHQLRDKYLFENTTLQNTR